MSSLNYSTAISKSDQEKLRKQFTRKLALQLRALREEKGLTQEDLAHQSGLNSAYFSHLERGIYSPTFFVIWRIAQALDMKMDQFMKGFDS